MKIKHILSDLGFRTCAALQRDVLFWLALLAGLVVVILLRVLLPATADQAGQRSALVLFNTLLWYPVLEEIFFRGFVQGQLLSNRWARSSCAGFSYANWLTSLLFVAFHFVYHPPLWALSVLAPSLVFGFFRDRHNSVYPPLLLHIVYNLEFVLILA